MQAKTLDQLYSQIVTLHQESFPSMFNYKIQRELKKALSFFKPIENQIMKQPPIIFLLPVTIREFHLEEGQNGYKTVQVLAKALGYDSSNTKSAKGYIMEFAKGNYPPACHFLGDLIFISDILPYNVIVHEIFHHSMETLLNINTKRRIYNLYKKAEQ